jgi:hypothetical protein
MTRFKLAEHDTLKTIAAQYTGSCIDCPWDCISSLNF